MFNPWTHMVEIGFDFLSDPAVYHVKATGEDVDVGIIPIDEAETYQAVMGKHEFSDTTVVARLTARQLADGPIEGDVITYNGKRYKVTPVRDELDGVYVVHLKLTNR